MTFTFSEQIVSLTNTFTHVKRKSDLNHYACNCITVLISKQTQYNNDFCYHHGIIKDLHETTIA